MGIHAVIDFETTGLSPALGARPTEVAIILIAEGKIVDRFQSLMNPGVSIPNDIQALTGITNEMVRKAPKVEVVIRDAVQFVGTHPIVAHNAAFDSKFWDAELRRINGRRKQEFACSMLLARRIFPEAPNHKLGTLVRTLGLPATGRYHRALADAEATAYLLLHIQQELQRRFHLSAASHELLVAIQTASRSQLDACIRRYRSIER
ncbi:MAG: 3'-5' exonuclease [Candidatus Accumulibacter sp.]|uniref:DNA-directed DNA polymerase n=1 Tax=Candidatus Accumulibacter affinis TaxID=2954384 RepID=A0A935TC65_9PROT|nr:3'-5' exonuclease [Candidatus Accumulibacter affinis]